jgi:hypothetical protein
MFILDEQTFYECIELLGHVPACDVICVPKINRDYKNGIRIFKFYVNPYNLCWYVDDNWLRYNKDKFEVSFKVSNFFTLKYTDFRKTIINQILK